VEILSRYRWLIIGIGSVVVVVAFLAFRPDKLFIDDAVDESLDEAFAPLVTTTTTPPISTTTTVAPAPPENGSSTTAAPTTTTGAPSVPTAVTVGAFYGIDHSAEGTATVYEQDGRFVLRFEDDTDIQNGPDLYVWVLPTEDFEGGTPPDYIDLGKIKGNIGGQNYELPPEFDPTLHQTVLIWCLRFSAPFAAVPLA
jgi:hypothetical protein